MALQSSGQISLVNIGREYDDERAHQLSEFSEHVYKAYGETIAFSEFYGKSAQSIILQLKTFSVYAMHTAVIPVANILEGSFDEFSDGNDPLRFLSVQQALGGTVIINGATVHFTSTGNIGEPASFQFTVENTAGVRKSQQVLMTVEPVPTIICYPETYNLQQNETLLLPASELLVNDEDQSGAALHVIGVSAVSGGEVSMFNGNISFVSTGLAGEPAEFEYLVRNTHGAQQSGRVFINVTPLPEVESFIYRSSDEVNTVIAGYQPPSVEAIFNTWGRFDGNRFYANKAAAEAANNINATAWEFKTQPDRVVMPLNVGPSNGFVSLEKVDNYTVEVTLSSDNADNDTIGLVAAFKREAQYNELLTIVLNTGGTPPYATGCGVYFGYIAAGSSGSQLLKEYDIGVGGGWNNRQVRVKIQRQGDIFTFYVSHWNDVDHYQPASKMVIDLNEYDMLHRFKGKQSYGYITNSQPNSTYLDEVFSGGLNVSRLYDIQTNRCWEYINGYWTQLNGTIQAHLGYIRKTFNRTTKERFLIKPSHIQYLGKLVVSQAFDSNKLLNGQQYALAGTDKAQHGAPYGIRVLALYTPGHEEKNDLQGKVALTTKSTHQNDRAVLRVNRMGERHWFANNGIDLDAVDYVGGTIVFEGGIVGRITDIGNDDGVAAYVFYQVVNYQLFDITR